MPYFLTLLLMFVPLTATAEIFTWTDANGVIHFAQEKPLGQEAQSVIVDEQKPATQPTQNTSAPVSEEVVEEESQAVVEEPQSTETLIEANQPEKAVMAEKNSVAAYIENNDAIKPNEGTAIVEVTEDVQPEQKSAAEYIQANKELKPAEGKADAQ